MLSPIYKHRYLQYTNEHAYGSRSSKANADKVIAAENTNSYDAGKFEEFKKSVIDESYWFRETCFYEGVT